MQVKESQCLKPSMEAMVGVVRRLEWLFQGLGISVATVPCSESLKLSPGKQNTIRNVLLKVTSSCESAKLREEIITHFFRYYYKDQVPHNEALRRRTSL